ncbi:hypothetical protein SFUMM280S_00588 [Streptomyces fumanus]
MSSAAIEGLRQDADGGQPGLGQPPGGGGDHGPALGRERAEQVSGARQQVHAPVGHVLDLQVLDPRDGLRHDSAVSRSAAISAAGRPCSSTRPNSSAVIPYSSAHRAQQRRTDSREDDEGAVVVEQQGGGADRHATDPTVYAGVGRIGPFPPRYKVTAMLDVLTLVTAVAALLLAAWCGWAAYRGQPTKDWHFIGMAVVTVLTLAQLVIGVVKLAQGQDPEQGTTIFVAYLLGAFACIPAAGFMSLAERTRWAR